MTLLKKIAIPLVSLIALGTSAIAYEVGDRMPDFSKGTFVSETMWFNSDMSKKGKLVEYDLDGDGVPDVAVAYRDCKGYKIVFGFYDFDKLYLDNNPRDKIIDEVIDNNIVGRKVRDDAPPCFQEA